MNFNCMFMLMRGIIYKNKNFAVSFFKLFFVKYWHERVTYGRDSARRLARAIKNVIKTVLFTNINTVISNIAI